MAKIRTHYDNLRVARNAPDSVIKAAYKALCQTYHPDKFQGSNAEAERIMKLINASYTVLIDPVKRAEHDAWIREKEAYANQQHEKATFGETGEATEQTYQKQETKREYTPPPTEPEPPKAKVVKTASPSMGWGFWVQMIVVLVIVKLVGLLGGLVAWGIWSLIAFVIRKYHIAWWAFAAVIVISLVALQLYLTSNQQPTIKDLPTTKNLVVGQKYVLKSAYSYDPAARVRLVGVPESLAAYDDTEEADKTIPCQHIPQGTSVSVLELQDAYGTKNAFVKVQIEEGECKGKDGWALAIDVQSSTVTSVAAQSVSQAATVTPNCIGDCINGQGTYTYPDGTKYVGEHKDNKRHGQGTFTGLNSTKYTGEFKDDKANGQGEFTYPDGSKYVGEFKDSNPNGQGTFTYANGNQYVGEFKDGKFNGQGTLTLANGTTYSGTTYSGTTYSGTTYSNRTLKSGLWKDGELVK